MSGLVVGFSMRMHKRATDAQEEATLGLEVPGGKLSWPFAGMSPRGLSYDLGCHLRGLPKCFFHAGGWDSN